MRRVYWADVSLYAFTLTTLRSVCANTGATLDETLVPQGYATVVHKDRSVVEDTMEMLAGTRG